MMNMLDKKSMKTMFLKIFSHKGNLEEMTKKCKIWEHVRKREGGVWQNVPNHKLKMRFIMTPTRLDNPLICVKTTIL